MTAVGHPSFCDARLCTDWPSNREHLGSPTVLDPGGDDVAVSVSAARLDEIGVFEIPGAEYVRLGLRDEVSATAGGDELHVAVYLTPQEARTLADFLVVQAARLEAAVQAVAIPAPRSERERTCPARV